MENNPRVAHRALIIATVCCSADLHVTVTEYQTKKQKKRGILLYHYSDDENSHCHRVVFI